MGPTRLASVKPNKHPLSSHGHGPPPSAGWMGIPVAAPQSGSAHCALPANICAGAVHHLSCGLTFSSPPGLTERPLYLQGALAFVQGADITRLRGIRGPRTMTFLVHSDPSKSAQGDKTDGNEDRHQLEGKEAERKPRRKREPGDTWGQGMSLRPPRPGDGVQRNSVTSTRELWGSRSKPSYRTRGRQCPRETQYPGLPMFFWARPWQRKLEQLLLVTVSVRMPMVTR